MGGVEGERRAVAGDEGAPRSAESRGAPRLVVLFGPPAVGKMTVGRELARLTGMRLFHNHMTLEPVLEIFEFGSPPFSRLVRAFRRQVFEEVAASDLPGLVFTYVLALGEPGDLGFIEELTAVFRARGGEVHFVELYAPLEERLRRNRTPQRLDAKPSKRNVDASEARLLENEARYRMSTGEGVPGPEGWIRVDNTELTPAEAAERVVAALGLERAPGG